LIIFSRLIWHSTWPVLHDLAQFQIANQLEPVLPFTKFQSPVQVAGVYISLGDKNQAFSRLEKGVYLVVSGDYDVSVNQSGPRCSRTHVFERCSRGQMRRSCERTPVTEQAP
jgi:hypothetical protein